MKYPPARSITKRLRKYAQHSDGLDPAENYLTELISQVMSLSPSLRTYYVKMLQAAITNPKEAEEMAERISEVRFLVQKRYAGPSAAGNRQQDPQKDELDEEHCKPDSQPDITIIAKLDSGEESLFLIEHKLGAALNDGQVRKYLHLWQASIYSQSRFGGVIAVTRSESEYKRYLQSHDATRDDTGKSPQLHGGLTWQMIGTALAIWLEDHGDSAEPDERVWTAELLSYLREEEGIMTDPIPLDLADDLQAGILLVPMLRSALQESFSELEPDEEADSNGYADYSKSEHQIFIGAQTRLRNSGELWLAYVEIPDSEGRLWIHQLRPADRWNAKGVQSLRDIIEPGVILEGTALARYQHSMLVRYVKSAVAGVREQITATQSGSV